MSEVQDVLNSRRTVYKFTKQEVEQDKINQALLAASNAPCHKHTHPWKFFIMGNLVRQELIPTITKLANEKSQKNLCCNAVSWARPRAGHIVFFCDPSRPTRGGRGHC